MATFDSVVIERSGNICEMCGAIHDLRVMAVEPLDNRGADEWIHICQSCGDQVEGKEELDEDHWRILNDSIWSPVPGVKIISWRILKRLTPTHWAQDLLDMMYLEEEESDWARQDPLSNSIIHLDSNGNKLEQGDTVVLIQDLKVKGANFTAKRGTSVRKISLVQDNPEHIEGKVNDQHIVILTKYVKRSK